MVGARERKGEKGEKETVNRGKEKENFKKEKM